MKVYLNYFTGIESLWRCIVEGFGPWLQVIYVSKIAGMPWIEPDRDTAAHMVKALRDVVELAHCKTIGIWSIDTIYLPFPTCRRILKHPMQTSFIHCDKSRNC